MKGDEDVYSGTICKDSTSGDGGTQSEREVARYFGVHRKTVKKMCQYAVPPDYQRKKEPISPKV